MPDTLHINDRMALAKGLNLDIEQFDHLVESANKAYEYFKNSGPFYGSEDINEPTFRITAEAVSLPQAEIDKLKVIGKDLVKLGRSLVKLPQDYKNKIGNDLDFRAPITFRIDSILNNNNKLVINEIEGMDGAVSLMVAEQLAYDLRPVASLTHAKLIELFKKIFSNRPVKIAFIRSNVLTNPYTANAKRFIELLENYSNNEITPDLFDLDDLKLKKETPDFTSYDGIFNDTYLSPKELFAVGVPEEKLLTAGNYSALVVKGVFALVFEKELEEFFITEIGKESLERLRDMLIPTHFINSKEDLELARKNEKVVKVAWAKDNMAVANRSAGVAIPKGETVHATEQRWKELESYLDLGYTLIAQDFVEPKGIEAFLRKKGTSLEKINWHNRICIKFVPTDNPNNIEVPEVEITAMEATLGPDIIPAGRACAFTAVIF